MLCLKESSLIGKVLKPLVLKIPVLLLCNTYISAYFRLMNLSRALSPKAPIPPLVRAICYLLKAKSLFYWKAFVVNLDYYLLLKLSFLGVKNWKLFPSENSLLESFEDYNTYGVKGVWGLISVLFNSEYLPTWGDFEMSLLFV